MKMFHPYNNRLTSIWLLFAIIGYMVVAQSCRKDALNIKSDKSLVIPSDLKDFQALLDADINNQSFPSLGEIGADNYYLLYTLWQTLSTDQQNEYVWAKDVYPGTSLVNEWNAPYRTVFYCNVVLEGLANLSSVQDSLVYKNIKGAALFLRAHAFYQIAQIFCKPYDSLTAKSDLGIPLKLSTDINEKVNRATVQKTYDQILSDLSLAENLLLPSISYVTRPSKVAAWALMSRIFLEIGNYEKALKYADLSLSAYPKLLDYNDLNPSASNPIKQFNSETIFYGQCAASRITVPSNFSVDTSIYNSFDQNDLRKTVFFTKQSTGQVTFKGNYTGSTLFFAGIANDEIYLVRAEAHARLGNTGGAMSDLNALLEKRFKIGKFVQQTSGNANEALTKILMERRKELMFRCRRWSDLRRLNKDPQFAITLTRMLNGQVYTLPPNDLRYVYPIPDYEILYSGIQQNPR